MTVYSDSAKGRITDNHCSPFPMTAASRHFKTSCTEGLINIARDKTMSTRIACVLGTIFLGLAQLSCAAQDMERINQEDKAAISSEGNQCFRLLKPRRVYAESKQEMCRALEKELNRMCGSPSRTCELTFSEEAVGFSIPQWQLLDVNENRGLIEALVRGRVARREALSPGRADRETESTLRRIDGQEPTRRSAILRKAAIDLFNRGIPEDVYTLRTEACGLNDSEWDQFGSETFLGRDANVNDDPQMRAQAARGRSPYPGSDQISSSPQDIFLYQGRAYVMHWGVQPYVADLVTSFIPSGDPRSPIEMVGAIPVCEFSE